MGAHKFSPSSEQHDTGYTMIIGFLLLGVVALCGASRPPRRGAFAPVPEITSATPFIIEGDIAVTERSVGFGPTTNSLRAAQDLLWPRGIVPYRIDTEEWEGVIEPVFLDSQIENITQALQKIEHGVPCIEFRQVNKSYPGFHLIYTNMGAPNLSAHLCFSHMGRADGPGRHGQGQVVNLGSADCLTVGKILHETVHSLGAGFEHTRWDRDGFVKILHQNLMPGAERIFDTMSGDAHNTVGTPFDYDSVMMFGPTDFGVLDSSGNRMKTIEPLKPGVELGNLDSKTDLSLVDKIGLGRA